MLIFPYSYVKLLKIQNKSITFAITLQLYNTTYEKIITFKLTFCNNADNRRLYGSML